MFRTGTVSVSIEWRPKASSELQGKLGWGVVAVAVVIVVAGFRL